MNLVEEFAKFSLPEYVKQSTRDGNTPLGSLPFTKMIFFVAEVNLKNADYDSIMSIKPARQEDETYEYYKKRQRLQKFLGKWKPYFYDYSVYNKKKI